jgi:23S rRNA (uracil1939-C5)-methyltransferase
VPRTAPGDRVRVEIVEEHARWARGELVSIVEPSPVRVTPPCPLAAVCGGCHWQHVALDAQREAKVALVAGALRRSVAAGLELRPIATPAPALHWRRRARFHWTRPGDGAPDIPPPAGERAREPVIGLYAARSRRLIDVPTCPQLDPRLDAVLELVRKELGPSLRRNGELHFVVGEIGEVHVVVDGGCDPARAAALVGRAGIAGVSLRGVGRRRVQTFGKTRIELDAELVAAADDFAQATAEGNRALRAEVEVALGAGPGRLLELYAGAGNFTRDALASGWDVTATDRETPADTGAPPGSDDGGARWLPGLAEHVVARLADAGERFDAVLLDPPRMGAREACAELGRLGPRRIVYVSCDPATLGRDADVLLGQGYEPRWARPVDLMPQTAHVEVVCVFERG